MKKILLASTILGMTSGIAAADIAFTGTATAGIASYEGGDFEFYNSFKLSVAATGETDTGITFGVNTSISAHGTEYDFDGFTSVSSDTADLSNPEVFVSTSFGKLSFKVDGYKDFYADDDNDYDFEYSHSVAGFSVAVRTDLNYHYGSSISLGYEGNGIKVGLVYDDESSDDGDAYKASAAYTTGPVTLGVAASDDDYDGQLSYVSVAYSENGLSASLEAVSDDTYTVKAGYSFDAYSLSLEFDDSDWEANASYDLGGGLKAVAGANSDDSLLIGAEMSF